VLTSNASQLMPATHQNPRQHVTNAEEQMSLAARTAFAMQIMHVSTKFANTAEKMVNLAAQAETNVPLQTLIVVFQVPASNAENGAKRQPALKNVQQGLIGPVMIAKQLMLNVMHRQTQYQLANTIATTLMVHAQKMVRRRAKQNVTLTAPNVRQRD
jgi:hypothetical protein